MIRVLGLALYGSLAASTRYRLAQYVDGLAGFGVQLEIKSLLDDAYLNRRFAGRMPSLPDLMQSAIRRFRDLRDVRDYDVAMLHCELFPFMPGRVERDLIRLPYIYDFDDAFYLKYRQGRFGFSRAVLGSKFDTVISSARHVTAGNRHLASYAAAVNSCTSLLPTVVDTARYRVSPAARGSSKFTIGWVGSPSTATYLGALVEPLSIAARSFPLRFVVIGGRAPIIQNVEVIELPWSEAVEVATINSFDVGVMPLPDDDWARGKCAFKLIQYMACGVPVIASPIGANAELVSPDVGYLASTASEWVAAMHALQANAARRREMGMAARERIETHYSLRSTLPVLASVLTSAKA